MTPLKTTAWEANVSSVSPSSEQIKELWVALGLEIVSYLIPFPPTSNSLGCGLATLIFAKTRFCSHINFIGRCLESKVIPKGFCSNFHAFMFSPSNQQYLHAIQCPQSVFFT